jgi:hypothetical protein
MLQSFIHFSDPGGQIVLSLILKSLGISTLMQSLRTLGADLARRVHFEPLEPRCLLSGEITVASFLTYDLTPTFDEPHVAADAQGNFVVAWSGATGTAASSPSEVLAQRFSSSGSSVGSAIDVSSGSVSAPDVGMGANGNFVVTWYDGVANFGSNGNLLDTTSSGGAYNEFAPAPAGVDGQGNFAIDGYQSIQRYSSNGSPTGSPLGYNGGALAMNVSGNFAVTWQESDQIYAMTFAANGSAISGQILVSNTAGATDERFPSISINASGGFAVAWDDYSNAKTYAQLFSANGTPIGSNVQVTQGTSYYNPGVAINADGSFEVAGVGPSPADAVEVQEFTSLASPVGSPLVLSQPGELDPLGGMLATTPSGFDAAWADYPSPDTGQIGTGKIIAEQINLPEPAAMCLILGSTLIVLRRRAARSKLKTVHPRHADEAPAMSSPFCF